MSESLRRCARVHLDILNKRQAGYVTQLSDMLRYITRIPGVRRLWSKYPLGSPRLRTEYDVWDRPNYAYGILSAARLARSLELEAISVIEFGVAGGNGLIAMERISHQIEKESGVRIEVYGFDSGTGMPAPGDYRDLPHVWEAGFYRMDVDQLKRRLQRSRLLLGDVSVTVPDFLAQEHAPIGFVAFDLDYYSSTMHAFAIFRGHSHTRLPRVYCYFDDTIWPEHACHNEYIGELCAIRDFNAEHRSRKIAKIENLRWMRRYPARWNEQMYVCHDFEHELYTRLVTPQGDQYRQLRLA